MALDPQPGRRRILRALLLGALLLFILFRLSISFFKVSTPSMSDTLLPSDVIVVYKGTFGYRVGTTRILGWTMPEVGDILVFNYPEGDTVFPAHLNMSYYQLGRDHGRGSIADPNYKILNIAPKGFRSLSLGEAEYRAIADREVFVSRCQGGPGDTLHLVRGELRLNEELVPFPLQGKLTYHIRFTGSVNHSALSKKLDIPLDDLQPLDDSTYSIALLPHAAAKLASSRLVALLEQEQHDPGFSSPYSVLPYFPHDSAFNWTEDFLGPIIIPKRGLTVSLSKQTLPLYRRVIEAYEAKKLLVRGDRIFINEKETKQYTFEQDYYWVISDNRHRAMDSRFWGFLPFDHIIGRTNMVVYNFSADDGPKWERTFKVIE